VIIRWSDNLGRNVRRQNFIIIRQQLLNNYITLFVAPPITPTPDGISVLGVIDATGQNILGKIEARGASALGVITDSISILGEIDGEGTNAAGRIDTKGSSVLGKI